MDIRTTSPHTVKIRTDPAHQEGPAVPTPTAAAAAALTGGAVLGLTILAFAGALFLGGFGATILAHRAHRAAIEAAVTGQTNAEAARRAACADRDNALLAATDLRAQVDTANLAAATAQITATRAIERYAEQYRRLYQRFEDEMRNYGVNIDGDSLSPHPNPTTNPRGFTVWWRSLAGDPR